jgi:hypothetical protein
LAVRGGLRDQVNAPTSAMDETVLAALVEHVLGDDELASSS